MAFKAIVLRTAGINCDYESRHVLERLGFEVDLVHINSFIRKEVSLDDYNFLFLAGGFSHGDYLGSGKILANKLIYGLGDQVPEFIKNGNLVVGICNGFQILVKAGLLPGFEEDYKRQELSLTFNDSGRFQAEWVKLKNANKGKCIFSKGIKEMDVPIAHGEGKFIAKNAAVLRELERRDQIVFKYIGNPNGSMDDIAGICDESGRVLGMMPHPERAQYYWQLPFSTRQRVPEKTTGFKVFENALDYLKANF